MQAQLAIMMIFVRTHPPCGSAGRTASARLQVFMQYSIKITYIGTTCWMHTYPHTCICCYSRCVQRSCAVELRMSMHNFASHFGCRCCSLISHTFTHSLFLALSTAIFHLRSAFLPLFIFLDVRWLPHLHITCILFLFSRCIHMYVACHKYHGMHGGNGTLVKRATSSSFRPIAVWRGLCFLVCPLLI